MKSLCNYKNLWSKCELTSWSTWISIMLAVNLNIFSEGRYFIIQADQAKAYGIALLFNIGLYILLIGMVIWITAYLDQHFSWTKNRQQRIQKQILWGVLLPISTAICFETLYFMYFDLQVVSIGYLGKCSCQFLVVFLILNIYLFYNRNKKNIPITPKATVRPLKEVNSVLLNTIACIYIENKNYFALNFNGEKTIWNDSLSESLTYLPIQNFYPIKRSMIVNRKAILAVKIINAKKTSITLVKPIDLELQVSQRENSTFKKWLRKENINEVDC